jgi:hypothetical protein
MITAYRQKTTVRPDGCIEIKTPSLKPGTKTEVIILVDNDPDEAKARQERAREWRALFKETQALPQAQTISEAEIAAEIAAYRAAKKI